MSDPDLSADLAARLKMIRYRAWHRGFREADFVLGRFADARLQTLTPAELDEFEALLEEPDQLLFTWIIGQEPVPDHVRCKVFSLLQEFHLTAGRG